MYLAKGGNVVINISGKPAIIDLLHTYCCSYMHIAIFSNSLMNDISPVQFRSLTISLGLNPLQLSYVSHGLVLKQEFDLLGSNRILGNGNTGTPTTLASEVAGMIFGNRWAEYKS